jgi:hypothetical protein
MIPDGRDSWFRFCLGRAFARQQERNQAMEVRSMRSLQLTMLIGMLLFANILPASGARTQASQRCFVETGLCIDGRIREFWEQNGGLAAFGLPITPQQEQLIEGQPRQVQWFERNRLELHPDRQRPYDVLLGRLGVDRLSAQGRDWFQFPKSAPQIGCQFFPQSGHNICGEILRAWRAGGLEFDGKKGKSADESLALFGLPISDAQTEMIAGLPYTAQWFERARFELHPENAPPYNVLLGLLGRESDSSACGPAAPPGAGIWVSRAGYDAWNWQDKALLRATQFLYQTDQEVGGWWAQGDDEWMPWMVNHAYRERFPAALPARPGKNLGWTDWVYGCP